MTTAQNLTDQTDTDTGLDGSEDAAIAAFNARRAPKKEAADSDGESEETTSEAEPDPEPKDSDETEPDEGDPESDDDAESLAEVEYEGKTYKVAPELQKALLRQSDYSRKMNEVSAKDKVLSQRMEAAEVMAQGAQELAEAIAETKLIDRQLKHYEGVDLRALRSENPAEFAAVAAEIQMLRMSKADAEAKTAAINGKVQTAKSQDYAALKTEMAKALDKHLPGWKGDLGVKITGYALSLGYTEDDVSKLTDPRVVVALDKARRYDAMHASKGELKAKAADVPRIVKPGAPVRRDKTNDAMSSFRKSKSDDDAVAVFMSRAASNRKR